VLGLGRRFLGSRDGLVLGVKAGLGDRIVASLFYVCEGAVQTVYHYSPLLRLLVPDGFHQKRAVAWRDDPPACLACMRCDPGSGALHKMSGLWAPRYTLGLDARRRFTLETFSSSVNDAYLYRFDLPKESLDFVGIKLRGAEGNGDHSRQAVEIAAIGKLSPHYRHRITVHRITVQGKQLKLLQ
jgi:hypothetical protein